MFNQKKYEKLSWIMYHGGLYMFTPEFYEWQYYKRERYNFLHSEDVEW